MNHKGLELQPSTLRNALGPGLLMAGAAVGVSYLVQSTRAGAEYGLALLGWMPIPLDAAAWHSLWTLERARETGSRPGVAHASTDFRIGYIGAVALAVAFMMLGASVGISPC